MRRQSLIEKALDLNIRQANIDDFSKVQGFYYDLIDAFDTLEYRPGWKKGIYPSDAFITKALQNGTMLVACEDDEIIGAVVFDHEGNEEYSNVEWAVDATPNETMMIHALGVSTKVMRGGIGRSLLAEIIKRSGEMGCKAIRLDVLTGNLAAERLYQKVGFKQICHKTMYYEDTGWHDFILYEYAI